MRCLTRRHPILKDAFEKGGRAIPRWLIVASVAVAVPILACGPFFPSSVLQWGDSALLEPHFANFEVELGHIRIPGVPFMAITSTNSPASQTFDAEISELREAITRNGNKPEDAARICAEFEAVRRTLHGYASALERWKQRAQFRGFSDPAVPRPQLAAATMLAGLPVEFADYLSGSVAFHDGDTNAAQASWKRLLNRPAAERQYRSTWAAFMLGKTWLEAAPEKAARYFQQTRELAGAGFKDALGLAVASYGWEARAALSRHEYTSAIRLYLSQHQAGDRTALVSLRLTMGKILTPPREDLLGLASDPVSQRVITAYLVSRRSLSDSDSPEELTQLMGSWLEAVEGAGIANVESADRLALAAYQHGLYELAERWLARAGPNAAMAQWLRAKLLLRSGKVDEAAKVLAQVVRQFPQEGDWPTPPIRSGEWDARSPLRKAMGELGVLRLGRRQYYEALDTLLRSGYWSDAAYIAEDVLTPDELVACVERHWPESDQADDSTEPEQALSFDNPGDLFPHMTLPRIRSLAARRLARLQRWDEAVEFFPDKWKPRLAAFVKALQLGRANDKPSDARALALWDAAQIARHEGMELFGTEVEPDWALFEGQFDWNHISDIRVVEQTATGLPLGPVRLTLGSENATEPRLTASSRDEQRRIREHKPSPDVRFHYRYLATDLAWEAAELMPDQTGATARVLWTAGTWLKTRDPNAADRFYKALVLRCGQTALGQEANRLHWFPKTAP